MNNYGKVIAIIVTALMLGAWSYAFSIDMRKVDKRENDQICKRLDRIEKKLDRYYEECSGRGG